MTTNTNKVVVCFSFLLAACAALGQCRAQGAAQVFAVSAPPGNYFLVVGPTGVIKLAPLKVVTPVVTPGGVIPGPVDTGPGPAELPALAEIARAAAAQVNDPETAVELARIWYAGARSKTGTYSQASQAVRVAQQLFLQQTGQAAAWADWPAAVDQALIRRATAGHQLDKSSVGDSAAGLAAASGSAEDGIFDGGGRRWLMVVLEIIRGIMSGDQIDFPTIIELILKIVTGANDPTNNGAIQKAASNG